MLSGIGASTLPPDIFLTALKQNSIISDNDIKTTRVIIPFSKRKRLVYGNLKYQHKQTFEFQYQGYTISFILFDPNDSRAELTLLHLPINTTPEVIEYIFNAINPNWKTSEIRLEPGVEMRHDRWQLMLECSDRNEIPHYIGLPKRGAEKEDLKIKVLSPAVCRLASTARVTIVQTNARHHRRPAPSRAVLQTARHATQQGCHLKALT